MANDDAKAKLFKSPVVRISYPALHAPRPSKQVAGQPVRPALYGSTLIFDERTKRDPTYQERMTKLVSGIGVEAQTVFSKEFIGSGAPWFDNQAWKSPWLDGGLPKYVTKSGLGAGTRFIRPTSNRIIPCVDRTGAPITNTEVLYPGCYVYALLSVYSYTNTENHGVSFGLRGIQFVEDGERLDDAVDVSEYFDALEGDALPGGASEETLAAMFKVS